MTSMQMERSPRTLICRPVYLCLSVGFLFVNYDNSRTKRPIITEFVPYDTWICVQSNCADDITADIRSTNRSIFTIAITTSLFQLERRSKLKMLKMLLDICTTYINFGHSSDETVRQGFKISPVLDKL